MGHAVHYRDAGGAEHFEGVASLDAALELVEQLRNDVGAEDVRVYREVPIEVKTYYRVVAVEDGAPADAVEAAAAGQRDQMEAVAPGGAEAHALSGAVVMSPPPPPASEPDGEVDAEPRSEARRALFSRG